MRSKNYAEKAIIATVCAIGLASAITTPKIIEKRDQSISRIEQKISNFDGKPGLTQDDWEILYSKMGGAYTSKHRPGLYLQSLYEIEERLPEIIGKINR